MIGTDAHKAARDETIKKLCLLKKALVGGEMELKPCPFCGSDDALTVWNRLNGTVSIMCEDCDTIGPRADYLSAAEKAWNTRAREGE